MNREQAIALASKLAEDTAASFKLEPWGAGYRVTQTGEPDSPCFWVTDNPDKDADFDPSEAYFYQPTPAIAPQNDRFVVCQNNTDGGGFVWVDADTCFETPF
jgi:hypothetical protein